MSKLIEAQKRVIEYHKDMKKPETFCEAFKVSYKKDSFIDVFKRFVYSFFGK